MKTELVLVTHEVYEDGAVIKTELRSNIYLRRNGNFLTVGGSSVELLVYIFV